MRPDHVPAPGLPRCTPLQAALVALSGVAGVSPLIARAGPDDEGFRNGSTREIEVRQFIERSGATRVIDLPGERRFIDRIVFWFKTPALARERATVQVWARG
jgi:hypothetical protein